MGTSLSSALDQFAKEKGFRLQGALSIALIVTQHARKMGLPLDPEKLVTKGGGQVLGAGGDAVQSILSRHGIVRILAAEGGRTSRNSLKNMREYAAFLNELEGEADLDEIELFWIGRVHQFFAGKPFKIKLDASRSLRTVVRDVIAQAVERQKNSPGMQFSGAVLQHLVGAKLECVLGNDSIEHNSFSTADTPGGRSGDFLAGDVAIHVTTSPGEAVVRKCRDNLNDGLRPLIITLQKGLTVAEELAGNLGISDRIDVFEVEQFVALNLHEWSKFGAVGRKTAVADLVGRYNDIIEEFETDPSLKIELHP